MRCNLKDRDTSTQELGAVISDVRHFWLKNAERHDVAVVWTCEIDGKIYEAVKLMDQETLGM